MFPVLVPQGDSREEVKKIAIKNGCKPKWWPYYDTYVCGCKDELHFCDQQCSIISRESAKRRR